MLDGTNLTNSTLEILSLLAVAFLLGYLLRLFMGNKWRTSYETLESENYALTNDLAASNSKIKSLEDNTNYLKSQVERSKTRTLESTGALSVSSGSATSGSTKNKDIKSTKVATSSSSTATVARSIPSPKPLSKTSTSGKNGTAKTTTAVSKTSFQQKRTTTETKKGTSSRSSATKSRPSLTSKTAKTTAKKSGSKSKKDDLTKVEGIGPKIQEIFNKSGIRSFEDLGENTPTKLRKILKEAGPRYKMHDPKTWPRQAKYAASGKWKKLKDYQDSLKGGRAG